MSQTENTRKVEVCSYYLNSFKGYKEDTEELQPGITSCWVGYNYNENVHEMQLLLEHLQHLSMSCVYSYCHWE